jgi:GTP-binding protein HflX
VLNKADLLPSAYQKECLRSERPGSVLVSALSGEGLPDLFARLAQRLANHWVRLKLNFPYEEGNLVGELHATGTVLATRYEPEGIAVEAVLSRAAAGRWRRFDASERGR